MRYGFHMFCIIMLFMCILYLLYYLSDVDECKKGTDGCSDICRNTDGGFICECRDPRARLSNDLKNCIRKYLT